MKSCRSHGPQAVTAKQMFALSLTRLWVKVDQLRQRNSRSTTTTMSLRPRIRPSDSRHLTLSSALNLMSRECRLLTVHCEVQSWVWPRSCMYFRVPLSSASRQCHRKSPKKLSREFNINYKCTPIVLAHLANKSQRPQHRTTTYQSPSKGNGPSAT